MTDRTEELAYKLADNVARSDIETYCLWTSEMPIGRWFDTQKLDSHVRDLDLRHAIDEALEYLDGRGMLERCPDRAEWVRIKTRESGDGKHD